MCGIDKWEIIVERKFHYDKCIIRHVNCGEYAMFHADICIACNKEIPEKYRVIRYIYNRTLSTPETSELFLMLRKSSPDLNVSEVI